MIRRFLRQKLGSIGLAIALLLFCLLMAGPLAVSGGMAPTFGVATVVVFLLAAGIVSRDVSGGAVQMILSRPLRRTDYLLGRYVGFLTTLAIVLAFAIALGFLLHEAGRLAFGGQAGRYLWTPALIGAGGALLQGALLGAILLFLSTFLPGFSDLLALIAATVALAVLGGIPRFPKLAEAANAARENLYPSVDWGPVFRGEALLSPDLGRYMLAVTVYLLLAAWIFSRREFAYGQD
jgi:ABC-type transport system involved in multi-copper enzyme maturation permease subunit